MLCVRWRPHILHQPGGPRNPVSGLSGATGPNHERRAELRDVESFNVESE